MPVEHEQIRQRMVSEVGRVDAVLDVGWGDCGLVAFLADEVATEAIGIDLYHHGGNDQDPSEGSAAAGNGRCLQMDAQHMDAFADERFDAVVSVHVLHEIEDQHAALLEVRRVLKPGGIVFIADFTDGETRWDEDYLTPEQVELLLRGASFGDIAVEPVRDEPFMFATARK